MKINYDLKEDEIHNRATMSLIQGYITAKEYYDTKDEEDAKIQCKLNGSLSRWNKRFGVLIFFYKDKIELHDTYANTKKVFLYYNDKEIINKLDEFFKEEDQKLQKR